MNTDSVYINLVSNWFLLCQGVQTMPNLGKTIFLAKIRKIKRTTFTFLNKTQ